MNRFAQIKCKKCDGPTVTIPMPDEWISFKDNPPKSAGFYLACDAFLGIVEKVEFDGKSRWNWMMTVTHWMPLPSPADQP